LEKMANLLTFDVGTTSIKAAVFNETFDVLGSFGREYALNTLPGARVELDPEIYWEMLKAAAAQFKRQGLLDGVRAVAVTTQGETLIPADRDGRPLDNAVVWLDARAAAEAAYLSDRVPADVFYRRTGLPEITAAMPVAKLLWYKNNRPDIYEKTCCFFLLEDFLMFRLTGRYVSNQSLLSSTGYFCIDTNEYWTEMLETAGLDARKLPEILPSAAVAGTASRPAQEELGLRPDTLVVTSAMDQIASAVGAGNTRPGVVTVTLGTALVVAATVESPAFGAPVKERVSIYRHYNKNYIYLPYCPTAAIILKWFKDNFLGAESEEAARRGESPYAPANALAEAAGPGAGGLLLLPHFTGKLSPDYNPDVKGVFYGVGLDTDKGCFVRAIMEGVAYMLRENLAFISEFGVKPDVVRLLGGGASSRVWRQIAADVCGAAVETFENRETASLGAGVMAAVACGLYNTPRETEEYILRKREYCEPNPGNAAIYDEYYGTYLALDAGIKEMLNKRGRIC